MNRLLIAKNRLYIFYFNKVVKTSYGMQLVTQFAGATKIQKGLLHCAHESTDTINTSKRLLRYITHASILDWQGTTYNFVLNWVEQVCKYDEIVGPAKVLNDATFLCHLQDCVALVPALKNIENMINVMAQGAAHAGAALTPEKNMHSIGS